MASRLFLAIAASFAALALLPHCSSGSSSSDAGANCTAPSCLPFDGSPPDEYVHDVGTPDGWTGDGSGPHPLCGVAPLPCNPDDALACSEGPPTAPDASASDAGADGSSSHMPDAALDASADAAARPRDSCTLAANTQEPRPACRPSGEEPEDGLCDSSADCAAGLACVGTELAAQCKPYCCGGSDVCSEGSYCAERPLRESLALGKEVRVPVCVAANRCDLAQPYPCPAEDQREGMCTCPDSKTACAVVRADGTTSCIEPGTGKAGEACPCAWDHICSQATGTCLKLCSTTAEDTCSAGKCQASANLPRGYGVCVGR